MLDDWLGQNPASTRKRISGILPGRRRAGPTGPRSTCTRQQPRQFQTRLSGRCSPMERDQRVPPYSNLLWTLSILAVLVGAAQRAYRELSVTGQRETGTAALFHKCGVAKNGVMVVARP